MERVQAAKVKIAVLLLLGAVHVYMSLYWVVPGHMTVDESIYHWSAREFSITGRLDIRNGYQERPSPELVHPFLRVHGGKLYSQYPALSTIVTAPFYRLAGFRGLFLANALAFVIVVLLCYATALRLFGDMNLALDCSLVLTLGTIAWEYSQAAWPHMLSVCFVSGAFYLFVCSLHASNRIRGMLFAFGSGMVAGLGPGIRLDAVCILPAIVVPLVCSRVMRIRELAAFLLGIVPSFAVLSWINYSRFGVFSPLADGNVSLDLGAAILRALLFTAALVLISRQAVLDFSRKYWKTIAFAMALGSCLLMLLPQVRGFLAEMVRNAYICVIDMSSFYTDIKPQAMVRDSFGAVIYNGGIKKALLQSLPFLAILIWPAFKSFQAGLNASSLRMLWLQPLALLIFCSYAFLRIASYEGGVCLNMRYFLPMLPFLSILCAFTVRDIKETWGYSPGMFSFLLAAAVTVVVYLLLVCVVPSRIEDLDFPLLVFPLALACLLLCFLAGGTLLRRLAAALPIRKVFFILLAAAFTWSSLVSFLYDYPRHTGWRALWYRTGGVLRGVVPPRSILFARESDPYMRLLEDDVIVAFPPLDRFEDFPGLLRFHLEAGRRAFGSFPKHVWNMLTGNGPLQAGNYTVSPVLDLGWAILAEISLPGRVAPGGGGSH